LPFKTETVAKIKVKQKNYKKFKKKNFEKQTKTKRMPICYELFYLEPKTKSEHSLHYPNEKQSDQTDRLRSHVQNGEDKTDAQCQLTHVSQDLSMI
jgi:hypothetical protein